VFWRPCRCTKRLPLPYRRVLIKFHLGAETRLRFFPSVVLAQAPSNGPRAVVVSGGIFVNAAFAILHASSSCHLLQDHRYPPVRHLSYSCSAVPVAARPAGPTRSSSLACRRPTWTPRGGLFSSCVHI
jgi:hypothetical protein